MAGLYDADQGTMLPIPDYENKIITITSAKTPFLKLVKHGKELATEACSWMVETYPNEFAVAVVDGTDTTAFDKNLRYPATTYIEWVRSKGWMVGTLAQANATAGVAKNREVPRAIMIDGIRLPKMLERLLLSTQTQQLGSGADPYKLEGALGYLDATNASPLPSIAKIAAGAKYTGALASFDATAFEVMMNASATVQSGPVDWTGIVGSRLKRTMTLWAQKVTDVNLATTAYFPHLNLSQQDQKIIQMVDFFKFDTGVCRTIPSYYLACDTTTGDPTAYTPRSGIFTDLSLWETRWHIPIQAREFPNLGGGRRGDSHCSVALICKSAAASGLVYTNT